MNEKNTVSFSKVIDGNSVIHHSFSLPFIVSYGDYKGEYTIIVSHLEFVQHPGMLQIEKFNVLGFLSQETNSFDDVSVILHNQIREEMLGVEGLTGVVEQVINKLVTIMKEKNIFYR